MREHPRNAAGWDVSLLRALDHRIARALHPGAVRRDVATSSLRIGKFAITNREEILSRGTVRLGVHVLALVGAQESDVNRRFVGPYREKAVKDGDGLVVSALVVQMPPIEAAVE